MIAVVNPRARYSPFGLGQVPAVALAPAAAPAPEPIEIDRMLADTTVAAIAGIDAAAKQDKGVTLEPCWRVLRVAKWGRILALRAKLAGFLASPSENFAISEDEFKLMDDVLACAVTLEAGENAELKGNLELAGIVIGIAGGLAALVATLF
jgi:hypothetical protein